MAIAGQYDFVPISEGFYSPLTLSVGIFQWIYRTDGHGLKKSKSVYRVRGPAHRWREINERARNLCNAWNSVGTSLDDMLFKKKKSETI